MKRLQYGRMHNFDKAVIVTVENCWLEGVYLISLMLGGTRKKPST